MRVSSHDCLLENANSTRPQKSVIIERFFLSNGIIFLPTYGIVPSFLVFLDSVEFIKTVNTGQLECKRIVNEINFSTVLRLYRVISSFQ